MIPAFVNQLGNTSNKTAGTTLAQTFGFTTTAGNLIVARVIFDNFTTASKPIVSSISKMAGETANWVFLGAARSTSTSGGAFASGEMWCIQTTVAWSGSFTVTLDSSVTQKALLFTEYSGTQAVVRSTTGTAYSTTTTAASAVTTGTAPVVNDLALGMVFGSNVAAVQAGSNNTTGGSWNSAGGFGSTGSSGATNNYGIGQHKILTATSHQTYANSAAMTAGNGAIVAILQSIPDPSITQAAYQFFDDAGTESGAAALAAQNTAVTGNLSNGDGYGQIRVRLQSTTAVAVPSTDDFMLQWEKNASGTWNNAISEALLTSYDETNESTVSTIGDNIASYVTVGEAFLGNGQKLSRARFRLSKLGTPTGTLTATLWAHTGTFGSGTGVGAVGGQLATSTTSLNPTTLTTTSTWMSFNFDGTYTLNNGTAYCIAVTLTGATLDAANCVQIGIDNTAATYAGSRVAQTSGGSWASSTVDLIFAVYTGGGTAAVIEYDSPTLTESAATTNRLTGGSGTFTPGKVSEIGHVTNVGWSGNNYTEILYSVKLIAAQLADGDTLRFRVLRNGATTNMTYAVTPTVNIAVVVPTVTQAAYRFFTSATESGSTGRAAQDTAWTLNYALTPSSTQLRIRLQSTNAEPLSATDDWRLQFAVNGGAWTSLTLGGAPGYFDGSSTTEGEATTNRLTGGTGSFVAGKVSEDGVVDDLNWSANNFTELVYVIDASGLSYGDVVTFRVVRNGSTTGMTYAVTPTINIVTPFYEWDRPIGITATVTCTDTLTTPSQNYNETGKSVTITATTTVPTDKAGRKELAVPVAVVATTTMPADQVDHKELILSLAVVATITSLDQADFKEVGGAVAIVSEVTATDVLVVGAINYVETDLPVSIISDVTVLDTYYEAPIYLTRRRYFARRALITYR